MYSSTATINGTTTTTLNVNKILLTAVAVVGTGCPAMTLSQCVSYNRIDCKTKFDSDRGGRVRKPSD